MDKIKLKPSLRKAFSWGSPDTKDPIGHIQTFKMHGVSLDANLHLANPMHQPFQGD